MLLLIESADAAGVGPVNPRQEIANHKLVGLPVPYASYCSLYATRYACQMKNPSKSLRVSKKAFDETLAKPLKLEQFGIFEPLRSSSCTRNVVIYKRKCSTN